MCHLDNMCSNLCCCSRFGSMLAINIFSAKLNKIKACNSGIILPLTAVAGRGQWLLTRTR